MRTLASLVCTAMLISSGHAQLSQVTNVTLHYKDGVTVARIDIKGPVRFTHQTEEADDGKPFRVVVDVLSSTHNLPAKNFLSLPKCPVQRIRSSQYAVKPVQIVRIVFDMEEETFYRIDSDKESISLFFPDKRRREFIPWSSTTGAAFAKEKRETGTKKADQLKNAASSSQFAKSDKSATELNKAIDKDKLFSLAGEPALPVSTTKSPEKKPTPVVKQPSATPNQSGTENLSPVHGDRKAPPVVVVDVPYGPELDLKMLEPPLPVAEAPVPSGTVPKTVEPQASEMREPVIEKPGVVSVKDKPAVSEKKLTPPTSGVTAKPPVDVALDKSERPKAAAAEQVVATSKPDNKNTAPVKPNQKRKIQSSKPKVSEKSGNKALKQKALSSGEKKAATPRPATVADNSSPKSTGKESQKDQKSARKSAQKNVTVSPAKASGRQKDKVSRDSTATMKNKKASSKKLPTSRFRRSPTRPTQIKGTLVAEFPKRLVIKYKTRSYRDPFETLVNEKKKYNSPIEKRVPNVEVIKLVGVLESDNGTNRALFEDKDGYGYILKEGDKVKKGYVLRVEPDRVYFQIFEYGWSRTLALNIE